MGVRSDPGALSHFSWCESLIRRGSAVALIATNAHFFALAQFAASHHLSAGKTAPLAVSSRGNAMSHFIIRLATAFAAASISGGLFSVMLFSPGVA
jgi:hypothetical protein